MLGRLKEILKNNEKAKKQILFLMVHPIKARPRLWLRLFSFLYIKRGRGSVIYRSVRKDIVPFNIFSIGRFSVIEDFATVNNAVGDISIGSYTRVGLGNTVIGPVDIGNYVQIAQNVVISGMNHTYDDPEKTILEQKVKISKITIEDDVWIGANSVITAGTLIGKHSVIAGGSVVINDVPEYSVVAGNPAKVIKRFDFGGKVWVKN